MGGRDLLYCTESIVELAEIVQIAQSLGHIAYESLTRLPEAVS
jgi:hypothetical protein